MAALDEATGVVEITPNGTPVYFQPGDSDSPNPSLRKRLYRIHAPYHHNPEHYDPEGVLALAQNAGEGWIEVPSVTEILDELYKPLQWWGMVTGVEGVMTLAVLGQLREIVQHERPAIGIQVDGEWIAASTEQVVDLLTATQLTVNHVRDKAAGRGRAVHDALEGWAKTGKLPDPNLYGAAEVGYVRGLVNFLRTVDPEPLVSEVMVASREYGYAGRYDLRLRVKRAVEVVVRCGLKRGPRLRRLRPGEILADLKSGKGVYDSHPRQLEGYEQASIESGYEPTVARGILHVTEAGEYEFVRSWSTFDDFLAVLNVWRSSQAMAARKKEMNKR